MVPGYLYHSINLLVGILFVPLFLKYLNTQEFVLWALFTTWGGLTLQIENSIQTVSVRRLAVLHQTGITKEFQYLVIQTRFVYRALSVATLLGVAFFGWYYLESLPNIHSSANWHSAWILFIFAYSLNYWNGENNAILLATDHTEAFSYIATLSRSINFALTFYALWSGMGLLGVCTSFAVSVLINCSLIRFQVHRKTIYPSGVASPQSRSEKNQVLLEIGRYMVFSISAFAIYKGGLLVAAKYFSDLEVGAYSLALQTFTMLSALALVPTQAWLSRLVSATSNGEVAAVVSELSRSLTVSNAVFLLGTTILVLTGDELLTLLGSKVMLPPKVHLIAIAVAFCIELNLLTLIYLLVTLQRFEFVKIYLGSVLVAATASVGALALGQPMVVSLVLLPVSFQLCICCPLVFGLVARHLGMRPTALMLGLLRLRPHI